MASCGEDGGDTQGHGLGGIADDLKLKMGEDAGGEDGWGRMNGEGQGGGAVDAYTLLKR